MASASLRRLSSNWVRMAGAATCSISCSSECRLDVLPMPQRFSRWVRWSALHMLGQSGVITAGHRRDLRQGNRLPENLRRDNHFRGCRSAQAVRQRSGGAPGALAMRAISELNPLSTTTSSSATRNDDTWASRPITGGPTRKPK